MKRKSLRLTVVISILIMLSLTVLTACGGSKSTGSGEKQTSTAEKLRLAALTTNTSSGYYAYWVGFGKAVNKGPNIEMTVLEGAGGVNNVKNMFKGSGDIAFLTTDLAYRAYNGIGEWKGEGVPDLRMLNVLDVSPLNYIVREDSGVKSIPELKGKSFNPGNPGSSTEQMAQNILAALGVEPKYYRAGTNDAVAALKDGQIIGYSKLSTLNNLDSSTLDVATFKPVRILGFSEDQIAKVLKEHPYYGSVTVKEGLYKLEGKPSPAYKTFSTSTAAATHKGISEDAIYRVTKAMWENFAETGAAYPPIKDTNILELTAEMSSIPLHAGVVRYLKEQGIKVSEKLIPPEAK